MKNYIIRCHGIQEHYFIDSRGTVQSHTADDRYHFRTIAVGMGADFGLLCDEYENVHIVGADKNNNIIYTHIRNNDISHHTLMSAKPSFVLSDFSVSSQRGILNLFYVAKIGTEMFLIHCVLGNNAMPGVLSKLSDKHYFLHDGRVYFSDADGTLGYCDFSDGKPTDFMPLFKNARSPYISGSGKDRHITWKSGSCVMLDGSPAIDASDAENPIITDGANALLMWESGGTVNYIPLTDTTAAPMRFVSTANPPQLFCVQDGDRMYRLYGTYSDGKINIFGKSNIFDITQTYPNTDLDKVIHLLNNMQTEISDIKSHIKNTAEKA